MKFTATRIPEVVLVEPKVFGDSRGWFMETWTQAKFAAAGLNIQFVQDNHSHSVAWTLRGMHYQLKQPQGKLVRVTHGEVFDVAVDMRRSSPTFGQWAGEHLSAENRRMLWVPPGFAHGFLVLSERADFQYKCSALYDPADERALHWRDAEINIEWPLPAGVEPIVSAKDAVAPTFAKAECYP